MSGFSTQGFNQFLQTVTTTTRQVGQVYGAVNNVVNAFGGLGSALGISSLARLGNLPTGAEETYESYTPVSWSLGSESSGNDWRVKLHLPTSVNSFMQSPILQPLYNSNNSMVFPTTPQIIVSHSANYNNLQPTHSNYAYPVYQGSSVEDITIVGEFPVENESDGRYWIAAVHFLRSSSKMFYGNSSNLGAPPPLLHLSGYGDFVFNKVPVVIKLFNLDLPDNVDYIQVPISESVDLSQTPELNRSSVPGGYSYVPTLSRINVTIAPVFSRDKTRRFSLDTYVQGGYIGGGQGII
jgi:hypothetical protein